MKKDYVLLKIRRTSILGFLKEIEALASGSKEEMKKEKDRILERNSKRNYSVSYYLSIFRIG